MKKREPISKIMTESVITLSVIDTLENAASLFKENHIRHIPVVSENKLVGMLSLTDMKRLSFFNPFSQEETPDEDDSAKAVYEMLSIEQVMANNPERVSRDTTIKEVAEIFATHEFHALPVVEEDELVGIVTTTDLIIFLIDQY